MKKKVLTLICALMMTVAANAQFEQGKLFVGASLTGLNLSYSGLSDLNLGVQGQMGYMVMDNLLIHGSAGYSHSGNDNVADQVFVGAGARYYILQNGIFLGMGAKLIHANHNYNDVMPGVEVGYAFFLNHHVTIEPSIYYDQSFKKHSDYSTIGLKVGFGLYF